ncbi:hypothetical protein GGR57DRAFT_501053 [Xylariaceae sp. FL1272]|nr:hypothetical protein GGR57DRAFT_501053 [Xylariaceae sp. FL1272]
MPSPPRPSAMPSEHTEASSKGESHRRKRSKPNQSHIGKDQASLGALPGSISERESLQSQPPSAHRGKTAFEDESPQTKSRSAQPHVELELFSSLRDPMPLPFINPPLFVWVKWYEGSLPAFSFGARPDPRPDTGKVRLNVLRVDDTKDKDPVPDPNKINPKSYMVLEAVQPILYSDDSVSPSAAKYYLAIFNGRNYEYAEEPNQITVGDIPIQEDIEIRTNNKKVNDLKKFLFHSEPDQRFKFRVEYWEEDRAKVVEWIDSESFRCKGSDELRVWDPELDVLDLSDAEKHFMLRLHHDTRFSFEWEEDVFGPPPDLPISASR